MPVSDLSLCLKKSWKTFKTPHFSPLKTLWYRTNTTGICSFQNKLSYHNKLLSRVICSLCIISDYFFTVSSADILLFVLMYPDGLLWTPVSSCPWLLFQHNNLFINFLRKYHHHMTSKITPITDLTLTEQTSPKCKLALIATSHHIVN